MVWNESDSPIGFYLHAALLQLPDMVSLDHRSISGRSPVDILNACLAKVILGIMLEAKEKSVAGSHILVIPLYSQLSRLAFIPTSASSAFISSSRRLALTSWE